MNPTPSKDEEIKPAKSVEAAAIKYADGATQHLSTILGWNPFMTARGAFVAGHAFANEEIHRLRERGDIYKAAQMVLQEEIQRLTSERDELVKVLKTLAADVQDYESWQRPVYALDQALELLNRLEDK